MKRFIRRNKKMRNHRNELTKPTFCHARRNEKWLSCKERRVDALALRADERRDKLRKALERSKYPLTQRYLNGET